MTFLFALNDVETCETRAMHRQLRRYLPKHQGGAVAPTGDLWFFTSDRHLRKGGCISEREKTRKPALIESKPAA
jgi:hypothetical protein